MKKILIKIRYGFLVLGLLCIPHTSLMAASTPALTQTQTAAVMGIITNFILDDDNAGLPTIVLDANAFVMKIKTSNQGISTNTQFEIPTSGNGYMYSVDCDSDGTDEETALTGDYVCEYDVAGEYTISITGDFPKIEFLKLQATDKEKLLDIVQWGTGVWQSMAYAFGGCINMTMSATDIPNLTNVTHMSGMFFDAVLFNTNIEDWNVSTVTDMSGMFNGATSYNQPLHNWDVSSVTTMQGMFQQASNFNQNIRHCVGIQCSALFRNIGWDVSNVTDMSNMFEDATSFDNSLYGWDVANVTDMRRMFAGATAFNQDIGRCDDGGTFWGQFACAQNGYGWNTGLVTKMTGMFSSATSFNQDISNWDVSNVSDMYQMFRNAQAFDQPLEDWDVSNVRDMGQMFLGVTLSIRNYTDLLIAWDMLILQRDVNFDAGNSFYLVQEAGSARHRIINSFTWTITDGGGI